MFSLSERLVGGTKRDQFAIENEHVVEKLPRIDKIVVRNDEQFA